MHAIAVVEDNPELLTDLVDGVHGEFRESLVMGGDHGGAGIAVNLAGVF